MLVRALESNWAVLFEEIGLWMPTEVIYKEHDDKPEGEEEFGNEPVFPYFFLLISLTFLNHTWLPKDTHFLINLTSLMCCFLLHPSLEDELWQNRTTRF